MVITPPTLHDSQRWTGKRIGLLGGSFNPPHYGHVHISLAALRGLRLDYVWWLVSPQNPLKEQKPIPMDARIEMSRRLITNPRIIVSDMERTLDTNITYDSIRAIKRVYPMTEFVWISGMDNAKTLHLWQNWQRLLEEVSMVHITRPPAKSLVKNCPLRMNGRQQHVYINTPAAYQLAPGTTYWMMQNKMVNISSTQIRQKQQKEI